MLSWSLVEALKLCHMLCVWAATTRTATFDKLSLGQVNRLM